MDSKIAVLGLGYIGLPTASILAVNGFWVVGIDINAQAVEIINNGHVHIYEPGLETLVRAVTFSGHLVARREVEPADVFIIAVPTPITSQKTADLTAVSAASEAIMPVLREGNLVILESTVPPRTTLDLVTPILEKSGLKAGEDFQVVHAPERVLPGQILKELVQNDRVIGGIDQASAERAREIYNRFVSGDIHLTDATTAELVKLVENTYRDVNIALANELALVSDKFKTDVWEVIRLANKHPRVNILQPGPGVGGHCIPVDPWFIVERAPCEAQLIKASRMRNDGMPEHVCESIMDMVLGILDPKITILGVAYKANVDDVRESPALELIDLLRSRGVQVKAHDPYVYPSMSLEEAVEDADCLAIIVNHQDYAELDPVDIAVRMRNGRLFLAIMSKNIQPWVDAGYMVRQLGCGWTEPAPSELIEQNLFSWV
ncbi:MAG: nucleotide sugar dehydrogenase [Candidatus Promineifilaceae bacterium]